MMSKKLIVFGVVVVLLVIGGIILFLGQKEEYSSKPTEWSQEGDYEISETAEGTVVKNIKAGFSLTVLET